MNVNKIKVLHVVDYNGVFGGLNLFLKRLLELLGEYGVEFYYLARMKQPYMSVEKMDLFDMPSADEIDVYEYIRHINPDVIHFHDYLDYNQTKWCIENYHTIRTFHDNYTFCPYGFYRDGKVCERYSMDECVGLGCMSDEELNNEKEHIDLLKKIDLTTCFSESILRKCIKYGFDETKIKKIPTLLQPEKDVKIVDNMPEENIIMFAGRIVESKGVECIIRSLIKIKDKDWKLILAGTGEKDYVKKLLRMCREEGIIHRVRFLGFMEHSQYINILSKSKIFVFSSLAPEGYGYTGAEAMLYGIPIVAFNTEGTEEWVKDNENGFVVPIGNIDDMAEAILKLLDDGEWGRVKKNAVDKVNNIVEIDVQAKILLDMYYSVAKEERRKV